MLGINKKFIKFRPSVSVSENKRQWWKYAIRASGEASWMKLRKDRVFTYMRNYKKYVKLYQAKLLLKYKQQPIADADAKELEQLEEKLFLDSILDARLICQEKVQVNNKINNKKSDKSKNMNNDKNESKKYEIVILKLNLKASMKSGRLKNVQSSKGKIERKLLMHIGHLLTH